MASFRVSVLAAFLLLGLGGARAQTVQTLYAGLLDGPQGVAIDGSGTLYVANAYSNTLDRITPAGVVSVLASTGLSGPSSVAINAAGTIFVANPAAGTVVTVAQDGTVSSFVGPAQGIGNPSGLAVDGAGNLYIADDEPVAIHKVTPDGTVTSFVTAAQGIARPTALAFDGAGNLYISDQGNETIEQVSPAGVVKTFATGLFPGNGLVVDASGNVFTVDASDILEVTPSGVVSTFAPAFGPEGLALGSNGTLYYTIQVGDALIAVSPTGTGSLFADNVIDRPLGIVTDGKGNLYIASAGTGAIVKRAADGTLTPFATGFIEPVGLAFGPDGSLYVSDNGTEKVSKVAPDGTVALLASNVNSGPVAVDATGNVYVGGPFTYYSEVSKITPAGAVSVFATLETAAPLGMAFDASGNLYVAGTAVTAISNDHNPGAISRITPAGTISTFAPGVAGPLVFDSAGNLLAGLGDQIVRFAPDGTPSVALTTAAFDSVAGLTIDPSGTLFTTTGGQVVQITLSPSPLASAVLPGARAVALGSPATIFGTLLNSAATAQSNCQIGSVFNPPVGLSVEYWPTDPTTNQVIGAANTPLPIAAQGSQSFVIGFTSTQAFAATDLVPVFSCDSVAPAPTIAGVNTVDLVFSTTPIADIIVIAATPSGNGIVTVPYSTGQGAAFALATIDAGAAGALTAVTDTGAANLPIAVGLCQSDPATAICLAPPAASVPITYAAGATPTFSIFVTASGAVPLDPAASRIFVRFVDGSGTIHGSTSVAVAAD